MDSPPGSPGKYSLNSNNLTVKQYFLVNLSKFLVEMIGTAVMGIFYLMIGDQQVGILLGMWVLTLFGEAISGAHYNPAITIVFMLRSKSRHFGSRRLKGFFYIAAQMLGGLIAALIAKFLLKGDNIELVPTPQMSPSIFQEGFDQNNVNYRITASMISEFIGSFVFIFLFMLCTDKKTQYSEDKVINCFIMSSAYVSARLMAGGALVTHLPKLSDVKLDQDTNENFWEITGQSYVGPLLNPALAFGQIVFSWNWQFWYIYPVLPFAGSAAALVFYEFVFVKSQEYLNGDDDSEESDGGLSLASDTEKLNKDIQRSASTTEEAAQDAEKLEDEDD